MVSCLDWNILDTISGSVADPKQKFRIRFRIWPGVSLDPNLDSSLE